MRSIRIMSRLSSRIKNWNLLRKLRWTSIKLIPGGKTKAGYIFTRRQGFKRTSKWTTNSPVAFVAYLTIPSSASPDIAAVFHALLYGRFIEIKSNLKRKELHRTNLGSNFLGSNFSDRANVKAPIQFRRENQHQHLKILIFFFKNRPMYFQINSISVIRPITQNQLKLTSHFFTQSTESCRSDSSLEANARRLVSWT